MKVLHVLQTSLPSLTGYCIRSSGLMRALRQHGVDVVGITGGTEKGGKAPSEEIEGIRYYRTAWHDPGLPSPLREWSLTRALSRRLREVIAAEGPDIVHAHSPAYNGLAALSAARSAGIPCVYEMRAVWEEAAVDQKKFTASSLLYRASRALESHVVKRAAAAVTICRGLERELLARGIPGEKIFVAPNGVDPVALEPPPRDEGLAASLGLGDAYVFGFVGSFFNYEGVEDLLDAVPAVWAQHSNAAFLLVGGGERETAVRERVASLRDPRVVHRQRVPHHRVKAYYSLIDCLVYPRRSVRLTELVTPLKPLEAMAMGRLVVATDIGGHRELIENGQTGFLYDPRRSEALVAMLGRVLREPAAGARVAAAGREYVSSQRSWSRITENHLQAYGYARSAYHQRRP